MRPTVNKTLFATPLLLGALAFACSSAVSKTSITETTAEPDPPAAAEKRRIFDPVLAELEKRSVPQEFIQKLVADPQTAFHERFVKINVTGYRKPADYSHNYNAASVAESKKFLAANDSLLSAAERIYGVPKHAIAAILWVETKMGKVTGNSHVASVFLSVALCNQEQYLSVNKQVITADTSLDEPTRDSLMRVVEQRANKKTEWALGELQALAKLDTMTEPMRPLELRGSWAGAFGLPQFLPSSYLRWAVDGNGDGKRDLFCTEDAVMSVANYLVQHGWSTQRADQERAVWGYNNSKAYVEAVLTLADKISE